MRVHHRSNSWLTIFAAFVCLTFSLLTGAWSAPAAGVSANDAAQTVAKPKQAESSKIEVPPALATLRDSFVSTDNKKLVIYIQNGYAQEKSQEKIADLVQFYSNRYGTNFVAYEGNESRIDSGKSFQLWDAEDAGLHQKSLKLFQNALRVRQEATNVLEEYESTLVKGFEKIASEEAKQLFQLERSYDEGKLELLAYVQELISILKKKSVTFSDLPQIGSLLEIAKREKQLAGQADRVSFDYEIDQIKNNEFFEELKDLEQRARYVVYQQSLEQRISRAVRRLHILNAMVNLSATRDDLDQYWANDFTFSETCFLSVTRSIEGQNKWVPSRQNFLDDLIQPANDFYVLALKRDRALASNLLKSLKKQPSAIFVGGSFYAPGITQKLKKEGVSYVLLSPKQSGLGKKTQKAYSDSINKFSGN